MTPILFRSLLCSWSGWGRAAWKLAEAIERKGQAVRFSTEIGADTAYGEVSDWVLERRATAKNHTLCIQCTGPMIAPAEPEKTVFLTMWESTGVLPAWVQRINQCRALVVPSAFNAATFTAAGVRVPVYICPLGVDTEMFSPAVQDEAKLFTVGMSGRWHLGGTRKGHVEGIRAFRDAFHGRDDVRLEIKCFEDDPVPDFGDKRITIHREAWTEAVLAEWYGSLDLYLDPSLGEGWGLQTHEAAACGTPVAAPLWSGRTEYLHEQNCLPLAYDVVPGPEPYGPMGVMAKPRHEAMIQALRFAESNWDRLPVLGEAASKQVSRFTWDHAAGRMLEILGRVA